MGLDIYAGTLTRYYSGNWKTIVQQWGQHNNTSVEIVRPNEESNSLTDPIEIQEISEQWRDSLAESLKDHTDAIVYWNENNDAPYYTDKPDWDGFGAVILWALYNEQKIKPPIQFDNNWSTSEIFSSSQSENYKTIYASLTQDCEIWLPLDIDFTFRYIDPTNENEVGIASSLRLFDDLNSLNSSTWKADIETIEQWKKIIEPKTQLLEEKAKHGFSILYDIARFSVDNKTPIKLDY